MHHMNIKETKNINPKQPATEIMHNIDSSIVY
jgi:hypothetical protein